MNKKLSNLINRTLDKIVEKSIKNYKPKNKFASQLFILMEILF